MGREIRRVIPSWEHPKKERYDVRQGRYVQGFQPLFDEPFAPKMREWFAAWEKWERGEKPEGAEETEHFWDWDGGPPDPTYYRPDWKAEEMTWWQVYETVSEGTPVTPAFATAYELIDYLATYGDYWDQSRGDGAWTRANAQSFVERGFAMSGVMIVGTGEMFAPRDGMPS
jgi:hypothetical protein